MILPKSVISTIDEYIDFEITNNIQSSDLLRISTMIDVLKNSDDLVDQEYLAEEILKINHLYEIDSEDVKERKTQFARRNAYLSALKKKEKRDLVKNIVFIIVKTFKIEETSFHFFKNMCELILGRSVDKTFILENFSNAKLVDNKTEKLINKRTGSEKIKLNFLYEDYIYLTCFFKSNPSFSGSDFMKIFNYQMNKIDRIFEGVKVEMENLTEEEKKKLELYFLALKEKEKIKNEIDLSVEKPEIIKRKRL